MVNFDFFFFAKKKLIKKPEIENVRRSFIRTFEKIVQEIFRRI